MPGSNTADWWRYSGVNGARVWPTPTTVEPTDDLAPFGDGVTSQATFIARQIALRADPLNTTYINWPKFESELREQPHDRQQHHQSELRVHPTPQPENRLRRRNQLHERQLPLGSRPAPPPAGPTAGKNGNTSTPRRSTSPRISTSTASRCTTNPTATTSPPAEWLERLRFTSDAVQAAVADVNRIYGKHLDAQVQAPVTAGNPLTYYPTWGAPVMQNLHTNAIQWRRSQLQSHPNLRLPALRPLARLLRHRARQRKIHRERRRPPARRCVSPSAK